MIETGMNEDIKLARTISDSSATSIDREVAEIKSRHLPPIVIGQVVMFITAQVGMVLLSALLIREHKRRLKLGRRDYPSPAPAATPALM